MHHLKRCFALILATALSTSPPYLILGGKAPPWGLQPGNFYQDRLPSTQTLRSAFGSEAESKPVTNLLLRYWFPQTPPFMTPAHGSRARKHSYSRHEVKKSREKRMPGASDDDFVRRPAENTKIAVTTSRDKNHARQQHFEGALLAVPRLGPRRFLAPTHPLSALLLPSAFGVVSAANATASQFDKYSEVSRIRFCGIPEQHIV